MKNEFDPLKNEFEPRYVPTLSSCLDCKIGRPILKNMESWLETPVGEQCPPEPHELAPCKDLPFWAMPVAYKATFTISVHCTAQEPIEKDEE